MSPTPVRSDAWPDAPPERIIAFQGQLGAYSHLACRERFPDLVVGPCHAFEDAFAAVREGRARLAMIPVDNTLAGRVADVHHLMPSSSLFITGEHFLRVSHNLLALPGARLADIQVVESHVHALGQTRQFIRRHHLQPRVVADTAGAAADLARSGDRTRAAIASTLAAEIHGLQILAADIEDAEHNTTRFLVLAREPATPPVDAGPAVTTFVFQVRNVPAALYKALGGFATNGVNIVKLESYIDGAFMQARFYADIIGHPQQEPVRRALEELQYFAHDLQILGVYPAARFREGLG